MGNDSPTASPRASGAQKVGVEDRFERLDYAERWLGDGFRVAQANQPGFLVFVDVEMTRVRVLIDRLRERGVRGSYAAVVVRAVALALSRHSDLHTLVIGSRRLRPGDVTIGLSVDNEAAAAPVMRLEGVASKQLPLLCEEIVRRAPEVRAEDSRTLAKLRRWGWLIPTGWIRRFLLRMLFSSLRFRRLFGSLQVTILPSVDLATSLVCGATAVVAMGRVAERVVVRAGQPAVRLMATLSCTGDHKVWSGERVGRLLGEIRLILESDVLFPELPEAAVEGSPRAFEDGAAVGRPASELLPSRGVVPLDPSSLE
jgi:pyruvate/2-oxoglutarate dehydrogenase complex dihydrolipoamide acyltransferase (E2) component